MKKLLIAAVIASAVAVVHAASVNWTSGTFTTGFSSPDGAKLSGDSFTMSVSVFSDSLGKSLIGSGSDNTPNGGGALTGSVDGLVADSDYYASAIITGTDANGLAWTREAAISAFHVPAQGTATLNFNDGSNFAESGAKWGQWSSNVPEPTSGLLLLLGVAGMALKRKRA